MKKTVQEDIKKKEIKKKEHTPQIENFQLSISPGERLLPLQDYLLKNASRDHIVPVKDILDYFIV